CVLLFCMFFLLGFLLEETPCEHGENMQTPHREAQEIAHLSTVHSGEDLPPSANSPARGTRAYDLLAVRRQCKQCKQLSHRATRNELCTSQTLFSVCDMKRSLVPTCPPSKTCSPPESGNGQEKSLQTPHTLDTNYSNSSPLVDATDHCSPKPPDTKTVSSPSLSHYCTANPLLHIYLSLHFSHSSPLLCTTVVQHFTATVCSHSALYILF